MNLARVSASPWTLPEQGQLVLCRDRHWVVADVVAGQLPLDPLAADDTQVQHLLTLSSVEDDGLGDLLRVIWELEPGAQALATATLPEPRAGHFDPPEQLAAFLDAIRWGAVTSADTAALQAPFRSGITVEDYQLDPVVRALEMPRVNLGIFDDVGLGKTIEAGLVVQELLLRHRARTVWVVCPPNLSLKWQEEMLQKFGLEFRIADSALVRQLRRDRGLAANVFTHYPRLIVSMEWVKLESAQRLLNDVLPGQPGYPRKFDLLIVDEVHTCAPAGTGKYATDSLRTKAIRRLAPHFEHRLFLSATPHNGYRESFTALLELLDPQRFARGVEPNEGLLARSIVRRLKSTMREDPELGLRPDGTPRFAKRTVISIPVAYPPSEREAHALLAEYTKARRATAAKATAAQRSAADFVTLLLKKRLLSSPEAFARTLEVHRRTLANKAAQVDERALHTAFDRVDGDDFDDDAEREQAEEDAVAAAGRAIGVPSAAEMALLKKMQEWADTAAGAPDAKTLKLFEEMDTWLRPEGKWNDERLIIFTEYRDTQAWLQRLLDARGIGGERVALLYGGMDPEDRERVKREFQADPKVTSVRVLLATDAASEGIDLQRHCRRLVHMEIPFNPNRLEQRNGRIDRHLQPFPEVFCYHFVSDQYEHAPAGSLEADLEFLSRVAHKVEAIRDDLGSAGQVLAEQVQEAMLGRRQTLDEGRLDSERSKKAKAQLARLERDLRERFRLLHQKVQESQAELGISPETVERAVTIGLRLGRQAPLKPVTIPARDAWPEVRGFEVPPLTRSWARAAADLWDPITERNRPITFDPAAAGRDDVVLAHLGSRLVAQSLRLLRAQVWSAGADAHMSRVTAFITDDPAVTSVTAVAHARMVVSGSDGRRLHEEVIYAGGRLPARGRFARIDSLTELRSVLAVPSIGQPNQLVQEQLEDAWERAREPLFAALQARADTRYESLKAVLARTAEKEKADIAMVLEELRSTIAAELEEKVAPNVEQLALDFGESERQQLRADLDALRNRLDAIPDEIVEEQRLIDARFADPSSLLFPAAVTVVIPRRLADDLGAGS